MNCRNARNRFGHLLDDPSRYSNVTAHLSRCRQCKQDFGRYQIVASNLGAWLPAPPPAKLSVRIAQPGDTQPIASRVNGWLSTLAAAVALTALLALRERLPKNAVREEKNLTLAAERGPHTQQQVELPYGHWAFEPAGVMQMLEGLLSLQTRNDSAYRAQSYAPKAAPDPHKQ